MPVAAEKIERLLREGFPDAQITLTDTRGDQDHYAVHIISPVFAGKSRLQQHQLVFAALKGLMDNELHALAVSTAAA